MSRVQRNRIVYDEDDAIDPTDPALATKDLFIEDISPAPDTTTVLLRRVFFFNAEKSRYFSLGFYPACNYQDFAEFGGPRIAPITLTEQHVKTLVEHLSKLCEVMCRCEHYACKDDLFHLQSTGTCTTARIYRDKKFVSFADLRYMMNMLHFVQVQQTEYILAQNVMAYAVGALGLTEFVYLLIMPPVSFHTISCLTNTERYSYKTAVIHSYI